MKLHYIRSILISLIFCLCLFSFSVASSRSAFADDVNLVKNGSFESPPSSYTYITDPPPPSQHMSPQDLEPQPSPICVSAPTTSPRQQRAPQKTRTRPSKQPSQPSPKETPLSGQQQSSPTAAPASQARILIRI